MRESLYETIKNYVGNQKNSLKAKGLVGLIILGVGLAGCESTNSNSKITPAMSLSVIARANAMKTNDPKKAQAWATTSDFADKYGDRENQLDAANAGRNNNNENQNNNNGNQNNNTKKEEEKLPDGMIRLDNYSLITCNYIEDLNKDNTIRYSDGEFVGIKKKFKLKEKITYAISNLKTKKGDKIKMIIKNSNGDVLSINDFGESEDGCFVRYVWYEPGRLKESNNAFWYKNDTYMGKSEVIIEEEKEETKKEEKKEEKK
jgi:hypothetical protein